jgi:PAS domain S-box-containing protein
MNMSALDQFETIWQNVENGIAIIDAESYEILDVNPAAIRLFGGPKSVIVGNPCRDVFCPAQQCPILELNQVVDRSERKFIKADGTIIPIIKSVSKIKYNGRDALLENFTDVSHIKEAEEQKLALGVAEQANKAKSAFLANMSHEIRTPMNAIIGMTSIGLAADRDERKDYCFERIEEASKHLLGIINDILDMSKIEAGKFELSRVDFNFERMLQRVVNVNKYRIDEKRQKLNVHIDDSIPRTLYGDEQRLAQVFTNLVGNAVKFTPDQGQVSIDTEFQSEEGGVCTIKCTVADNGIGISPEQQSRLFHSFQQADSSTAIKFGGTGLGLSISKNIIEMMDGEIWVESELGKGSAFTFTVKVKRAADEEKTPGVADFTGVTDVVVGTNDTGVNYFTGITRIDGSTGITAACDKKQSEIPTFEGHTILIAEDVDINREIGQARLEPTMISICCAVNGAEAVRRFADAPDRYDAILMDIQMPELDGIEATKQIRALGISKAESVPIIAMTANVFKEDVENCIEAGMNDHVGKPLNFDEVFDKLRKYLF